MIKIIFTHLLTAYLSVGIFSGVLLQRAVPALNILGITYVTITWPNMIRCARASSNCDALPDLETAKYFYTFD